MIHLRAFVQGPTEDRAQPAAAELVERVRSVADKAKVNVKPLKPYWKVEGWFEVVVQLFVESEEALLQERLATALGTGWTWGRTRQFGVLPVHQGKARCAVEGVQWIGLDQVEPT